MKHIAALRDRLKLAGSPAHEIGTLLLSLTNSPIFAVAALTAYMKAAQADWEDVQRATDELHKRLYPSPKGGIQ